MEVAVIGAGVSGLFSIKSCLEEGLRPTCFEKTEDIGGIWVYRDRYRDGDPVGAYRDLRCNTSVFTHEASDFPSPVTRTQPTGDDHLNYIRSYARHFNLHEHIRFKTEVISVQPYGGDKWNVQWLEHGAVQWKTFGAVIVSSGRFRRPLVPAIQGLDEFEGEVLTAEKFKHNEQEEVANRRVLVVGNSVTAADTAAVMAETAAKVYISIGRGSSLISTSLCGVPLDTLALTRLLAGGGAANSPLARAVIKKNMNDTLPQQEKYGIGTKGTDFFRRPFLLASRDLASHIRKGKVKILQTLVKLDQNTAVFDDGESVRVDTVVIAKGWDVEFPFLSTDIVAGTANELELYKLTWPLTTRANNLAFVGCVKILGAFNPVVELQARWVVQVFQGKCHLPDQDSMLRAILERKRIVTERIGFPATQPETPVLQFQDFLAKQIHALPIWWRHLPNNPRLALVLKWGPAFPCTYRLEGPHPCPGAPGRTLELYRRWREILPVPRYFESVLCSLMLAIFSFVCYKIYSIFP